MNIVVVFTDNNARIIKNPPDLEIYKFMDNALVNPDLSSVWGIPPHFWVKTDSRIIAMSPEESKERMRHHKKHGSINHLKEITIPQEFSKNKIYQALLAGLIIGAGLGAMLDAFMRRL